MLADVSVVQLNESNPESLAAAYSKIAVTQSPEGDRVFSDTSPPTAFQAFVTCSSYASEGGVVGAKVYIINFRPRVQYWIDVPTKKHT